MRCPGRSESGLSPNKHIKPKEWGGEAFRQLCWVSGRQVERLRSFAYYESATCCYTDCSCCLCMCLWCSMAFSGAFLSHCCLVGLLKWQAGCALQCQPHKHSELPRHGLWPHRHSLVGPHGRGRGRGRAESVFRVIVAGRPLFRTLFPKQGVGLDLDS